MSISSLTPIGARDDVAARPGLRLGRADHAAVEKFLNLGMVARNLRDRAVADQIDAAVAGPEAGKPAVHGQQSGDGGADRRAARLRKSCGSRHAPGSADPRSARADPAPNWRCRSSPDARRCLPKRLRRPHARPCRRPRPRGRFAARSGNCPHCARARSPCG